MYKRQAQECISNKISTRDSYVNSTDYSKFGIYTQNSISQDIELPIETERYKIEDATDVNGDVYKRQVCINEKDLLGEPAIGRRFRGNVWMQGNLCLE